MKKTAYLHQPLPKCMLNLENYLAMEGLIHVSLIDHKQRLLACNKTCMKTWSEATGLGPDKILSQKIEVIFAAHPNVLNALIEELNQVFTSKMPKRFYKTVNIPKKYSINFITLRLPITDGNNNIYVLSLSQYLEIDSSESQTKSGLTKRAMDCLKLLLQKKSNKKISEELNISLRTLEKYFERIKQKFGAFSKDHLIERAQQLKIKESIQADQFAKESIMLFSVLDAKK